MIFWLPAYKLTRLLFAACRSTAALVRFALLLRADFSVRYLPNSHRSIETARVNEY